MMRILFYIGTFFLDIFFPIKNIGTDRITKHTGRVRLLDLHNLNVHREMSLTRLHSDVFYTLEYKQALAKRMIWNFKYYLNKDALQMCTYILYDQLIADTSDRVSKIPFHAPHILIHYPSSTYFKGDKIFDHMKELLSLLDSFQNQDEPFFTCCIHAVLPRQRQDATSEVVSGEVSEVVSEFMSSIMSGATSGASEDEHTPQHLGTRRQRFEWSKKRFVLSPTFEKYMQEHAHKNSLVTRMPQTAHISPKTYIYCIDDVVTTGASMQAVSKMLQERFNVEVVKFCICH